MISLLNHKWSKSVFSLINRFKPLSKSKAPDLRVSVSLLAAASFHMWRHVSVSVVVSVLSPSACWMMTACCCLTVCRLFVPAARRFLVFLSDCIVGAMELPSVCVGSAAVSAAAASTITLHCSSAFISFYEKLESSRTRTNVQIAAALSDGLKCDQLVPGTSRFRFCFVLRPSHFFKTWLFFGPPDQNTAASGSVLFKRYSWRRFSSSLWVMWHSELPE